MKRVERKILIRLREEQKYQEYRAAEYVAAKHIAKGLGLARKIVAKAFEEEEHERRERKVSKKRKLADRPGDGHEAGQG